MAEAASARPRPDPERRSGPPYRPVSSGRPGAPAHGAWIGLTARPRRRSSLASAWAETMRNASRPTARAPRDVLLGVVDGCLAPYDDAVQLLQTIPGVKAVAPPFWPR